jgi:hypothetical protein
MSFPGLCKGRLRLPSAFTGLAARLRHGMRGAAVRRHPAIGGGKDLASVASKPQVSDLAADARPRPLRRVTPGSLMGAPARRQARGAAPRRNPASERRSAPAGPAPDGHHRRDPPCPRTESTARERAALPGGAVPWSGPDHQDGQRGWTTCKCGNSRWHEWPSGRAGW